MPPWPPCCCCHYQFFGLTTILTPWLWGRLDHCCGSLPTITAPGLPSAFLVHHCHCHPALPVEWHVSRKNKFKNILTLPVAIPILFFCCCSGLYGSPITVICYCWVFLVIIKLALCLLYHHEVLMWFLIISNAGSNPGKHVQDGFGCCSPLT
jgi:hypothetical protein